MQYDMHYYGTYAMAAAAGIPHKDAETIATAAQFVDDQNFTGWQVSLSGEGIYGVATAHHPLEAGIRTMLEDSEANDNRRVWVPFHFLPGLEGETFHEKMVCRKDSRVVNKMLDHYLSDLVIREHKPHALHLMGIAAHVYADTFSHYGFSGIASPHNQIVNNSVIIDASHSQETKDYIAHKSNIFPKTFTDAWVEWTSAATEFASLGHGAVDTNPDRPYLKWSFIYEIDQEFSERDNSISFLAACEALYNRFRQFANVYYEKTPTPLYEWDAIKESVAEVIRTEGPGEQRVEYWMQAIQTGSLNKITECCKYDEKKWLGEIEALGTSDDTTEFRGSDAHMFFSAADYHRNYVLKRLLPSPEFDLMVA